MKKKTHRRKQIEHSSSCIFYNKNIWIHNSFYFNVFINAMSNTKRKLKLSFSKNWNVWLSIVRIKIIKYSIWKLIDFSKKIKSTNKLKFIKSDLNTQQNDNFTKKHVKYKIVFFKYKKKLQNWKKQKNFMTKIINHIYDITSIANLIFIEIIEIHSWNVLRFLKSRFSFFDSIKNLKLKQ